MQLILLLIQYCDSFINHSGFSLIKQVQDDIQQLTEEEMLIKYQTTINGSIFFWSFFEVIDPNFTEEGFLRIFEFFLYILPGSFAIDSAKLLFIYIPNLEEFYYKVIDYFPSTEEFEENILNRLFNDLVSALFDKSKPSLEDFYHSMGILVLRGLYRLFNLNNQRKNALKFVNQTVLDVFQQLSIKKYEEKDKFHRVIKNSIVLYEKFSVEMYEIDSTEMKRFLNEIYFIKIDNRFTKLSIFKYPIIMYALNKILNEQSFARVHDMLIVSIYGIFNCCVRLISNLMVDKGAEKNIKWDKMLVDYEENKIMELLNFTVKIRQNNGEYYSYPLSKGKIPELAKLLEFCKVIQKELSNHSCENQYFHSFFDALKAIEEISKLYINPAIKKVTQGQYIEIEDNFLQRHESYVYNKGERNN